MSAERGTRAGVRVRQSAAGEIEVEGWSATKICPKCEEPKPRREFRVYEEKVLTCRACRARARTRQYMRDKKATIKLKKRLERVVDKSKEVKREMTITQHLKVIKSHFLKVTAVARKRLTEMESSGNPSEKTIRAIKVRRALLDKYERAYELQQATVRVGGVFVSIEDLVSEH